MKEERKMKNLQRKRKEKRSPQRQNHRAMRIIAASGGRAAEARRTMIGREEENWPNKMSGGQRTAIPDRE